MGSGSFSRREFLAAGLGVAAVVAFGAEAGEAAGTGRILHPRGGALTGVPYRPYTLSPYDSGMLIEDAWPTIFFGEEVIPEIKRKANKLGWARKAIGQMTDEAAKVMANPPQLPMEPAGWRHDFYSRITGEHLLHNPLSSESFRDPSTGKNEYDDKERKAWALLTHERTYRIMRSLGVLYAITGDERYARWIADGMRKAVEYFRHTEFIKQGKISALYYQPLYDAAVLMALANIYSLTKSSDAYSKEDRDNILKVIFEARMGDMEAFLAANPGGNMSCYVSGALGCAGRLFERDDWTKRAMGESSGVRSLLMKGLCVDEDGKTDGLWREGTMFYHFYSMCPLVTVREQAKKSGNPIAKDVELWKRFEAMFEAPAQLVDQQLRMPLIGDLGAPKVMNLAAYRHLYEYAAGQLNPAKFGPILAEIYARSGARRMELSALAFGPDELPKPGGIPKGSTLLPAAKIGVFRSASAEKLQVLFRAGHFGGGHDHPDRLEISLSAFGQPISPDLGTSGYSIHPIVHNYYRSTIAHNTMFADEKEQTGEASLEWQPSAKPARARGVIVGEDGVKYQRTVFFAPPYVVLLDEFSSDDEHRFGWVYHAYGDVKVKGVEFADGSAEHLGMPALPGDHAFVMLTDRRSGVSNGPILAAWKNLRMTIVADVSVEVTAAKSPGNPIPDSMGCIVLRAPGKSLRIATVLEASQANGTVASVKLQGDSVIVGLNGGAENTYRF